MQTRKYEEILSNDILNLLKILPEEKQNEIKNMVLFEGKYALNINEIFDKLDLKYIPNIPYDDISYNGYRTKKATLIATNLLQINNLILQENTVDSKNINNKNINKIKNQLLIPAKLFSDVVKIIQNDTNIEDNTIIIYQKTAKMLDITVEQLNERLNQVLKEYVSN